MLKRMKILNAQEVYHKSPLFMQHVLTSVYGYKLKRERYSNIYRESLKRYVRGGVDQKESLIRFMNHLKNNIKVYKDIHIDENDIIGSFKQLPMTTKEDLRYELEDRSFIHGIIRNSVTSGSTGANLIVYDSEYDRENRMAFLDYIKYQNGVLPFSKRASFSGQELTLPDHKNKLWRYNLTMNQMLYTTRYLSPDNVSYVYDHLRRFQPLTMDGTPSALHMVAKYMLRHNLTAEWNVQAVFPTAEILLPHVKADLEKAFDTVVIDQYSTAEGAPFIYSDPGGGYIIGHETGLIEFFKVGHQLYEMVVTSFINDATPIVRYRVGDQVEMAAEADYLNSYEDECRIMKILGRGTDYLYAADGTKVTNIIISWIIDGFEDVLSHAQFVQKEMAAVIVNTVIEESYTGKDEMALRKRMHKLLGEDIDITFKYMDDIPKERSGKVRFIINEVGERDG